ncbi:hypothetical protein THOM_1688 [Trachipleistophora hominis]|uniref:Uncharacterized protein n=1 Tax=Trachipleistophora hominis TaxID=72359 RepID=L7JVR0_TRAHO|nr:hypothetical protein THOM_1688 [Trachipleistophora hominis]
MYVKMQMQNRSIVVALKSIDDRATIRLDTLCISKGCTIQKFNYKSFFKKLFIPGNDTIRTRNTVLKLELLFLIAGVSNQ